MVRRSGGSSAEELIMVGTARIGDVEWTITRERHRRRLRADARGGISVTAEPCSPSPWRAIT